MTTKYIHLNLHTEYSISDGIVRIDDLFAKLVQNNMPAVALTDQSNLFALVKFYKAAVSVGIKPIIGVDICLENETDLPHPTKMLLFAQNHHGYQNILQLISRSYIEGQYLGVPLVKRKWLQELSSGLIALSGAKYGDVGKSLLLDDVGKANEYAKFWQSVFPGRYYLELQRTGREREEEYLTKALDLAAELSLPVVATNNVCFLEPEDFEAHEARVCIHNGHILNDPQRPRLYSEKQYLRSEEEMLKLFNDIPESLSNSVIIAKRCNVQLTFGKTLLPVFPVPASTTPELFFANEARLGLEKRFKVTAISDELRKGYLERLEYEIKVINQMKFDGYFLIVADFISWSKRNGVSVGPGRGSGAGSLVAYALGITDLDPIKHGLLFERFLNPERVSLPDFDIDFCMEGRDRVIAYVAKLYGKDKVAQIITYGTMAARAVVRDVGRVLGYAYGFVDKIAKLIPFSLGITLEQALKEEEILSQKYDDEEEVRTLIDLAKKLEGIVRNAGKHAGGVVIAPQALTNYMPLYAESDTDGVITQFDMGDVETIGLVKFDFLGLRTLTIIDGALKAINTKRKSQGEVPLDINLLPLDDGPTYKLLQTGKTAAIFQLESRISHDIIRRFKPDCFSDIVVMVAIIRPGVLQSGMLDEIIDRKQGRARITYLHPKLEPILRPTYGVAIYQEQVMQMAQTLAGYSLGSADLLRRAMGKKKQDEMALQRAVFIEGALKNNVEKHLANTIFDYMEKFAGYGFNKSHSAAYALISYQTAWLKTHYPAEFMASVLSSDMDNTDKVVLFLGECKNLGLKIIAPDINVGNYHFMVNADNEIVYGLGAVKGVGQNAVEAILEARAAGGEFKNLFDLCKRVDTRKVNKRVLEALIYAGAFDKIAPSRARSISSVEIALKAAGQDEDKRLSGQVDLFSVLTADEEISQDYVAAEDSSKEERLKNEKNVLGFYLDGHPIEKFVPELNKFIHNSIAEINQETGKNVLIAGFIQAIKIVTTKSGNRLAIVTLEDSTASIDVTLFTDNLAASRACLIEDQLVIVEGEVAYDQFSNGFRIRATKAMNLDQARSIYAKGLLLKLSASDMGSEIMTNLYAILKEYRGGTCPIFITYDGEGASAKLVLGDEWKVKPSEELLKKLKDHFSDSTPCFVY
jgi:DNA polymerase III subunit alpha